MYQRDRTQIEEYYTTTITSHWDRSMIQPLNLTQCFTRDLMEQESAIIYTGLICVLEH